MSSVQPGFERIAERLRQSGHFGDVTVYSGGLSARAANSEEPAEYRLSLEGVRVWVSLVTAARYLSQSIEQTLVISGDKAGDLLRDELIDLGVLRSVNDPMPTVEHFRSPPPEKLYTFRTPLPLTPAELLTDAGQAAAGDWVLGYRATFDELGGMSGG